jgi:hypothetical protein
MNLPKKPRPSQGSGFPAGKVQVRSKKTQGYPCSSLVPVALATAHTTQIPVNLCTIGLCGTSESMDHGIMQDIPMLESMHYRIMWDIAMDALHNPMVHKFTANLITGMST